MTTTPRPSRRPPIVCLCGSTRFITEITRAAADLTLAGVIVVRPEVVSHATPDGSTHVPAAVKTALDALHLAKIDLADRVVVVDVGGYLGPSTRAEIAYATRTGKPVTYLSHGALDGTATR